MKIAQKGYGDFMESGLNRLKSTFMLCVSLIIVLSILVCSGTVASAETEAVTESASEAAEITPAIQEIIDLIDTLPADSELITINDKDTILEIKNKYEKLSDDEKIAFPTEKFTIYSTSQFALIPYLLDDVATRIEALGKKIKERDKKEVLEIYDEYLLLTEEAQSALSSKNTEKLLAAVKTVKSTNDESDKQGFKINLETIIIIVLSCLITLNLVLFIIVVVKMLSKKKERSSYEDESD